MKKKQPPGAKAPSKPQVETEGDADNEQIIPECLSRARANMPRIDSKQSLKMKRKQIQNPRHGQLMQLKLANSKDDMKFGTSQARLNEDEAVRVTYKHGTPLEGGKIGDSEPVDLYSSPHHIPK
ncbi:hypothetical protein L3X38_016659 [Prunus dulcis]|uniref:Uncharacterized protein n=1 Tax=Prunus dulcis TaxID=3755 RepID=A0AAD4ZA12_PRUDU|nr:hypothetical protein L3X38_016659 [Prunus dulcis]